MREESVLVIGSANMDLVVSAERFPKPGETILGNKFGMYPGGKGANQAVACAKLGMKTYFIGKMGNDIYKDRLIASMYNEGVDNSHLFIDENESTGIAIITVDCTGENEIIVVSGSNMKLTPEDIESKEKLFSRCRIVLTQLETPIETVLKSALLAKEHGCLFLLNPAPARPLPMEILPLIDYLTPNETELQLLSNIKVTDDIKTIEKAATALIDRGVKNVIVTLGDKGAMLANGNNIQTYPARKVNVLDSTAAGDAFNGAFACMLAKGESADAAIRFAINAASISVTRMGAQSSMASLEEVLSLDKLL
jgi:ribokinase